MVFLVTRDSEVKKRIFLKFRRLPRTSFNPAYVFDLMTPLHKAFQLATVGGGVD